MEFEVSIFDSNQFEREYEQTPEGVNEAGEEMNHNCKFTSQAKTTENPKLDIKSPHEVFPKVEAEENMPLDLRANASNASLQPEGKKPNLDAKRVSSRRKEANVLASTSANADSQFVTIIKPYAVIRALVYLPSAFARPNGLMRRCKMILRDEKQRSWSVQLGPVGPRFGITRGWRQFREANAVQVGDTYKFELIDNGTIPVAYFCLFLRPTLTPPETIQSKLLTPTNRGIHAPPHHMPEPSQSDPTHLVSCTTISRGEGMELAS
ncbi:putative B3 domain-containing protein REM10-like [Capsicum annuum]|nr:putative B3 domain-containing protein REM10-like [Capsicum annuum]